MKDNYQTKLSDPRWQRRRLEIMSKAEWKCEVCGDKKIELHVHHVSYEENTEPWDYPDEYYKCLCDDCHKMAHIPIGKVLDYAQWIKKRQAMS